MMKMVKTLVISALVVSSVSAQSNVLDTLNNNKGKIAAGCALVAGAAYCYYNPEDTVGYAGKCLYSVGQVALPFAMSQVKSGILNLGLRLGFNAAYNTAFGSAGIAQGKQVVKKTAAQFKKPTRSNKKKQSKPSIFNQIGKTIVQNKEKIALGVLAVGAAYLAYRNQDSIVDTFNSVKKSVMQRISTQSQERTGVEVAEQNKKFQQMIAKLIPKHVSQPAPVVQPVQVAQPTMPKVTTYAQEVNESPILSKIKGFFDPMLQRAKKNIAEELNHAPSYLTQEQRLRGCSSITGECPITETRCSMGMRLEQKDHADALRRVQWGNSAIGTTLRNVAKPLNVAIAGVQGLLNVGYSTRSKIELVPEFGMAEIFPDGSMIRVD